MTTFFFVGKIRRFVITEFLKLNLMNSILESNFVGGFYYYFRFQKYEYVSILAFYVLLFSCTAISTLCKLQRQVRKKSLQVAKSLFVLKLVNPLFFEANDRNEKKKSSHSTSNGFFCSLLLSSYKTEERGQKWIFFLHKKRAFLYVFVCKTMRNRK